MKYPKTNSLWKRDVDNLIIPGKYTCEEYKNINRWEITEKIDGTNIRVIYDAEDETLEFKGRTDRAQIPTFLLAKLKELFTTDKLKEVFTEGKVVLYGEGYGNKIQACGNKYSSDNGFALFDVLIVKDEFEYGVWLEFDSLNDIAKKLEIEIVPLLGYWTIDEITEYVKFNAKSAFAKQELVMEGIVAKSHPIMLDRLGHIIKFKLKCNDYVKYYNKLKQND